MSKIKLYSTGQITKMTGISRNRLFYLSKTMGTIQPALVTPGRQLFNEQAVQEFSLAQKMWKRGFRLFFISETIKKNRGAK